MTKAKSKNTALKNFFKDNKGFIVGLLIGLTFSIGLLSGLSFSIDYSIVNQLQHFTAEERTNDMFNPIVVENNLPFMEIEITLPFLTEIAHTDSADLLVSYWMIPNPIESVFDWATKGIFIQDFLISGEEYDSYCDTPDATDTYYTHFYRLWEVSANLQEGYTYMLYCDFYDALGTWWRCDNPFMGDGDAPEFDLNIIDGEEELDEDEVQDALLDCSYISFFVYQEPENYFPPEPPTDDGSDSSVGSIADTWVNQYTIFSGIKNGIALIIFGGILFLLLLLIAILLYIAKKSQKKGKKKGKKKK